MSGNITGFVLWFIVGCAFIGLGVYARSSQKPMGFWANAKVFAVTDVKKYNNVLLAKYICKKQNTDTSKLFAIDFIMYYR